MADDTELNGADKDWVSGAEANKLTGLSRRTLNRRAGAEQIRRRVKNKRYEYYLPDLAAMDASPDEQDETLKLLRQSHRFIELMMAPTRELNAALVQTLVGQLGELRERCKYLEGMHFQVISAREQALSFAADRELEKQRVLAREQHRAENRKLAASTMKQLAPVVLSRMMGHGDKLVQSLTVEQLDALIQFARDDQKPFLQQVRAQKSNGAATHQGDQNVS